MNGPGNGGRGSWEVDDFHEGIFPQHPGCKTPPAYMIKASITLSVKAFSWDPVSDGSF